MQMKEEENAVNLDSVIRGRQPEQEEQDAGANPEQDLTLPAAAALAEAPPANPKNALSGRSFFRWCKKTARTQDPELKVTPDRIGPSTVGAKSSPAMRPLCGTDPNN